MERNDLIAIAVLGAAAYLFMPKGEGGKPLSRKGGLGEMEGGLPSYAQTQGGGGADSPIIILDWPTTQKPFNPDIPDTKKVPTEPNGESGLPPWEESGMTEGTGTITKKEQSIIDQGLNYVKDNPIETLFVGSTAVSAAKGVYDLYKKGTPTTKKIPQPSSKLPKVVGKAGIVGAVGYLALSDKNPVIGDLLTNYITNPIISVLPKAASASPLTSYGEGAPFYQKNILGFYSPGKGQMDLSKKQLSMVSGSPGSPGFGTQNVPSWTSQKIKEDVKKYGSTRYSKPK